MELYVLATVSVSYITGWIMGYITCSVIRTANDLKTQEAKVTSKDLRPRD